MSDWAEQTVATILAAAGIRVTPEEEERFVAGYPRFRAQLDALYVVETPTEETLDRARRASDLE